MATFNENPVETQNHLDSLPEHILIDIANMLEPADNIAVCLVTNPRVRQIFARSIEGDALCIDLRTYGSLCRKLKRSELRSHMEMLANLMGDETEITNLKIVFNSNPATFDYFRRPRASRVFDSFRKLERLVLIDKTSGGWCNVPNSATTCDRPVRTPKLKHLKYVGLVRVPLDRTLGLMLQSIGPKLKTLWIKNGLINMTALKQIPKSVRTLIIFNPGSYNAAHLAHCIDQGHHIKHFVLVGPNRFLESIAYRIRNKTLDIQVVLNEYYTELVETASIFVLHIRRPDANTVPVANSLSPLQQYHIQRGLVLHELIWEPNEPLTTMTLVEARDVYDRLFEVREEPLSPLEQIADTIGMCSVVSTVASSALLWALTYPFKRRLVSPSVDSPQ